MQRLKPPPMLDLMNSSINTHNFDQLAHEIKQIGKNIGFDKIGIADLNLKDEATYFKKWLHLGYHGGMEYLKKNFELRKHPEKWIPDTIRVICCSINYSASQSFSHPIAAFAQTQDYSPYICNLLKQYVTAINKKINTHTNARVFSGNGPILEKSLAAKAGLGWYGKNSILINNTCGSYFFLGEILTNIPLPIDKPIANCCGKCSKCIDLCPTKALVAPGQLDARNCISYLTIEYDGIIPLHLRPLIGTRVFGCDTCQQVCPWNSLHKENPTTPFIPFNHFVADDLATWFLWDEKEFSDKTKNSPIQRIGYERWLRNIAIALGNSCPTKENFSALQTRLNHPSHLVCEHVRWALTNMLSNNPNFLV